VIRDFGLSIAQRQLEPGESLSEILFGLVMTLTFTLGAGILVREDPNAARELLVATIGCNVAWGIIDGAFYVSGNLFERARLAKVGRRVRAAETEEAAAVVVGEELEPLIGLAVGGSAEREDLYRRIARQIRAAPTKAPRLARADLYGAIASFWLVFFSSIPAALPFLFVRDAWVALRISNAILIAMLFVVGWRWARHTTLRPWLTGLTFTVAGVALVVLAIALGG
jgi:VIT1/CCC1 family predicted Fe2+/Mn2+ transporter